MTKKATKNNGQFVSRIQSFKYAIKGIFHVFNSQVNFRIHIVAAMAAIGLGFYLKIERIEWAILIVTVALVFAAELINTSLEYLTDIVSPEWNEKAGRVKDIAAGAVLIFAIGSVIVGILIFGPDLVEKFY